jgi:superfamily II DNA/RNA helicase
MSDGEVKDACTAFIQEEMGVLLAARASFGTDLPKVPMIINYNMPGEENENVLRLWHLSALSKKKHASSVPVRKPKRRCLNI